MAATGAARRRHGRRVAPRRPTPRTRLSREERAVRGHMAVLAVVSYCAGLVTMAILLAAL